MLPMCSTMSLRTVGAVIARSALGVGGSKDMKLQNGRKGKGRKRREEMKINVQG